MPIYPIPFEKVGSNSGTSVKGDPGESAYQIWLDLGNTGTEQDFITSLKGADGKDGTNGTDGKDGSDGSDGTNGTNGTDGKDGESAYQLAVDEGYSGTLTEWLASLKGKDGVDGTNGTNGKDATSPTRYFGLSPASGMYVKHALGDSGLYFVMKGTGNNDVGQGIYDSASPRVIGYRFVSFWSGSGVDGYYNQAYTTTSSPYIFDGTVYFDAEENLLAYVTDTTTGRIWKIERWGMSRLSGRYFIEITEITSDNPQTFTDYSSSTI